MISLATTPQSPQTRKRACRMSSPAAADTVNVIDEVNANITITTTVFYILAQ